MNKKEERKREEKKRKENVVIIILFILVFYICIDIKTEKRGKTLISIKDGINSWVKENSYWRLIEEKDITADFKGFFFF
jgi:hypothetical protein